MGSLRFGQIVLVSGLLDPQGRNPKDRPTIIVTPTEKIASGEPLIGVAISTSLPDPLPDNCVMLPWHPRRHSRTGLNKRCAAVCDWVARFEGSQVLKIVGFVPGPVLDRITALLTRSDAD